MKTAEEIASDIYWAEDDASTGLEIRALIAKGVEADRAQLIDLAEARASIDATYEAAEGDSNDAEIEALQDARDQLQIIVEGMGGKW